jgi:hypothetical protein
MTSQDSSKFRENWLQFDEFVFRYAEEKLGANCELNLNGILVP